MKKQRPTRTDIQDKAKETLEGMIKLKDDADDIGEIKLMESVILGLNQIIENKGFKSDEPLTNVGIIGFHLMMKVLDFKVESKNTFYNGSHNLDQMKVRSNKRTKAFPLYNLVDPKQNEEIFKQLNLGNQFT